MPLAELVPSDRPWSRGHAHLGFDRIPLGMPGRLDFPPVKLAALDTIQSGHGYAMHEHRELESLLFVLDGVVRHEDSAGEHVHVMASECSLLSAGTGIAHAEFAASVRDVRAVVFAIAPDPARLGEAPKFSKRRFPRVERHERFVELASGRSGAAPSALPLRRNACLYAAALTAGAVVRRRLEAGRRAYLLAPDAAVSVNGARVGAGERVLAWGAGVLEVCAFGETEVLLLDLD